MVDLEFVGDYRNPQQLTARQRELGHDGQSDGDFTFDDFLDIINPLQHIPLVSTLYRQITGDEISPHARVLGDTLFGGPSGFVAAAANVFFEEVAGEDIGETVMAFFSGEEGAGDPQVAGSDGSAAPAIVPAGAAPLTTSAGPAAPATESSLPKCPSQAPSHTSSQAPSHTSSQPPSPPLSQGDVPQQERDAAAGLLTGDAALSALFNDLRRSPAAGPTQPAEARQAAAMPLPQQHDPAAMKSYPLPPRRVGGAAPAPQAQAAAPAAAAAEPGETAVHPLILAQDAPDADIAGQMMQALDKYRTMSRQGQTGPGGLQSGAEEARWQADPAPDGPRQGGPWQFDPATPPAGS